jgi:flagellar protein FliO/FliZ
MLPVAAIAAETLPQSTLFGSLVQALLGLLVVLALLYGFFWVLRRYGPAQTGAQGVVKVVGGVMLGPRERLVVVEVQDTWLLLGVAAGHVSTLHTLPKPEGAAAQAMPQGGAPASSFSERLAELLRRPRG